MKVAFRLLTSIAAMGIVIAPVPGADASSPHAIRAILTPEAQLRDFLQKVSAASDGTVGIAIHHIGTGKVIAINGETLFPMASTFKVAVAGAVLSQIDKGQITLDTMLPVDMAKLVDSEGIADIMRHPGVSLSIYNLLELMLTKSDNSATDMLVAQAGGPAAVTQWLRDQGISGQRIDSDTANLLYRAMGANPVGGTFHDNVAAAKMADASIHYRDMHDTPNMVFSDDPRDTSTPVAMVELLDRIAEGKALSKTSTDVLLDIMSRCQTGARRLKAMLPPDTRIVHKTGSLNGTANDVGIIGLPDGTAYSVAVFVMKDFKGRETRDRIMAETARAAYDYFLFTGA